MQTEAHQAMFNSFLQPDPHSMGLLNLLKEIYPNFAKQLFHRNPLMEKVVLSNMNPMEMLDYPICGRCETLAAWREPLVKEDGTVIPRCGCFATGCNHTTLNPITLRTWMIDILRHKAPPDIAEIAEIAVDSIAQTMMRIAMRDYQKAVFKTEFEQNKKMGILMPDGTEHAVDPVEQKKKQEYIESELAKARANFKKEKE